MSTSNPPDPSPTDRSRSHSRSRSPPSHPHQKHSSSSSKRRSASKSRSKSKSRSRDRNRHRRRHSRSRSRSRSRSPRSHSDSRSPRRHHHHHRDHDQHHRRRSRSPRSHKHHHHHSPRRHHSSSSSSHVKHEPGVKQEGSSNHHHHSHHSAAASSSKPEPVKFESALARLGPHRPGAAASSTSSATPSFHSNGSSNGFTASKAENEPSAKEVERMLEASAAQHREETQLASTNLEHINYKREKIEKAMAAKNAAPEKKAEANFGLSGLLAADANKDSGVIASDKAYREPPDARLPAQDAQWRLYVFKGKETVGPPLHLAKQSMFMIGRDEPTVDILIAHASCSKHHAVIQFRQKEVIGPEGNVAYLVKPYLMDLGSTNGTKIMGVKRDANKYYELLENDLIQFGYSTRDYVLLNAANKK